VETLGVGDIAAVCAGDIVAVCAGGIAVVCVEGVELCLKTSTSMPPGPDSSADGPEGGGPTFTPPRAVAGPAAAGGDEDADPTESGGEEEVEENEEHPASAGNRPIETTKRARAPWPRRPAVGLLTLTRARNPCVPMAPL
jgi:hypothetical protein